MTKKWLSIGTGIALISVLLFLHLFPVKMVIVGFKIDPPWQAERYLSETQRNAQWQAIAETRGKIIRSLRWGGFGIYGTKGFEYIPFFPAQVSITAYVFLLMHPLVSGIEEDSLSKPTSSVHGGPAI